MSVVEMIREYYSYNVIQLRLARDNKAEERCQGVCLIENAA